MGQNAPHVITEFRCHYCNVWFDTTQTGIHFSAVHEQDNVTFESLQERLSSLGGLDVRENVLESEEDEKPEPKKKNWLLSDDADAEYFDTNNFRHPR
jgi:hypothetical protein